MLLSYFRRKYVCVFSHWKVENGMRMASADLADLYIEFTEGHLQSVTDTISFPVST